MSSVSPALTTFEAAESKDSEVERVASNVLKRESIGGVPVSAGWSILPVLLALAADSGVAQVTESPSVVARGDWLVEADLMSVAFHREAAADGTLKQSTTSIGAVFLTSGIAAGVDLQIGTQLHHRDRISGPGYREVVSGRGDTYLRLKWNLAGDEGEEPALAVLPWVKFPTAADGVGNDETDWGLIVPFGMPLRGGSAFNAMVEVARVGDGSGGHETTWLLGAVAVKPLGERWQCYAEATAGFVSGGGSDSTATFGGGLRFSASEQLVFDFGLACGLTSATPDWNPVLRIEWGL